MVRERFLPAGHLIDGQYSIEKPLAAGGFAVVYLAKRLRDKLPVVIKVLKKSATKADPAALQRFSREAEVAEKIKHPNIIRTLAYGQSKDDQLYIVLELLQGRTLARAIYAKPTDAELVHEILVQLMRGLSYAHGLGIVHRDLKPSNIFICQPGHTSPMGDSEEDMVKLIDFGFVKVIAGSTGNQTPLTRAGQSVGTPGYMAPEMLTKGHVTPLIDIYSAGVIAFELLTGRQAFEGQGIQRAIAQIKKPPPTPPRTIRKLPVYDLVKRMMDKDPNKRPPSANAVLSELELLSSIDLELGGKKKWFSLF